MRILVVEDDHKIAGGIQRGLEHEKYAVTVVYDGKDGLDMAMGEVFDLILLDSMLPSFDGLEVCKQLRENKIHIPILMLTAKGQTEDKIEGLNAGADDYLTKPFSFAELLARIKALTRRQAIHSGTILSLADLAVNTINYEVKRGGNSIRLSNTEYALLEYLLRHKNEVVTKEQIISHVWDYDADVLPNSVEVYIKYLRNKIDSPFPAYPLIHTIRGFGYMISNKTP